jgi:poly(3-hydroxybutyrate) depolymerase
MKAHKELFFNLMKGNGDSIEKHTEFYDEYLAVMDLTAEFFLQTIDSVFVRHELAAGQMHHRGVPVDPAAITKTALLTVEGEKDDITGLGQCEAAHTLCANLPARMRMHYVQPGVGHYGIFNGARFQREIVPLIEGFIRRHDGKRQQLTGWRRLLDLVSGGRRKGEAGRVSPRPLAVQPGAQVSGSNRPIRAQGGLRQNSAATLPAAARKRVAR